MIWRGRGYYAQRAVGNDLETYHVGGEYVEASERARESHLDTPFFCESPEDAA